MMYFRNKDRIRSFSIMLILLLIAPVFTYAKNVNNGIAMMTLELVPYGYINKEGKEDGVFYDIMNEIITESSIGKSYGIFPAKRLVAEFANPKGMCTIVVNSPYVNNQLEVIEPIGYKMSVGVLPKAGIKLDSYLDLKNIIVALPRGVYVGDRFMNDKTITKASTPRYYSALLMLKAGRVDAVVGALQSFIYIAKNKEFTGQKFGKPLIFSENEPTLFCNNAVTKKVRKRLKSTLVQLKTSGKVQKILDRYFKSEMN